MTSDRKIRANRANARASTGPKTAQGRARSARNALRHALSLSVYSDPLVSEQVQTLAREIAGPDASAEIQDLARQIAEAQIDLRRVRYARISSSSRHRPNLTVSPEQTCGRRWQSPAGSWGRTRRVHR